MDVNATDVSMLSSPLSSPNVAALLKIKIVSWSHETGLPVSIRVMIGGRTFNVHKYPLFSKSGYFQRNLNEANEVELPQNFPGGAETFEKIALFIYGSSTSIDSFNVAALRCAADFLEMTQEYGSGNLCERFDIYLNQVVLQSWDDTIIVLHKCHSLLPLAEELLIVSRCIESLAFMASMEILDPERRREQPVVTIETLAIRPWSDEMVNELLHQEMWIKDLIALPFEFFKRIIASLRRQGMKERYVSPIILFYANIRLLSSYHVSTNDNVSTILQGIIDLLPMGEKASKMIPVGFYLSLLTKSLDLGLNREIWKRLQEQIISLLHFAQVEDFLLPKGEIDSNSSAMELAVMESMFSAYVSCSMDSGHTASPSCSIVAELWDKYLSHVAIHPQLSSKRFMDLIEIIPSSSRQTHDCLYRALNNFLLAHPNLSQQEKGSVCKYLNSQKLSQEVCIEAVQNDLMPLRLIVQALFVQQLNTHQAFKECSESFRYAHSGELSGSLSSSRYDNTKSQNLGETSYTDGSESGSRPISVLLHKDVEIHRHVSHSELPRKEYESTSFRIQNLEQELMYLKRSLQLDIISNKTEPISKKIEPVSEDLQRLRPYGLEKRAPSKKRNGHKQVTNCIGSVNLTSQRKYATKLLKIFRRINLFSRGRLLKRKPNTSG